MAIGGKGLRGCRRPDGDRHIGGIGELSADRGDLEAGRSGQESRGREAHLNPVGGGDRNFPSGPGGEPDVAAAQGDLYVDRFLRPVLDDHGQLEAIPVVQEARWRGANHQRQLGGDGAFPGAELA